MNTQDPKYPNVKVKLSGRDGNAYAIIGRVLGAMERGGVSERDRAAFSKEAMLGDYDDLLRTCTRWVSTS